LSHLLTLLCDECNDIGRGVCEQVERARERSQARGKSGELYMLKRPRLEQRRFALESGENGLQ